MDAFNMNSTVHPVVAAVLEARMVGWLIGEDGMG
jgi:hypothetical protein